VIGAIAGDVIGSTYEHHPVKDTNFDLFTHWSRFTDDTVCTIALADVLLHGGDYAEKLQEYCRRYPDAGYGGRFRQWIHSNPPVPYGSFGNGSAMRVAPVGLAFSLEKDVLDWAERSAMATHNHPEGIKGAQATALAVFLAANHADKMTIKKEISSRFNYNLDRHLDDIRPGYTFDVTCQGSVPESILAFLESNSYEESIRLAVSLGGDADTQACIAGGIAHGFYRTIPVEIEEKVRAFLPSEFMDILRKFTEHYGW
jgi:ADP-ribosylglycohydrolase